MGRKKKKMLAEEHLLPHVFCRVFTCGNLCDKKQSNRSTELNTKHSDISTKVGPEKKSMRLLWMHSIMATQCSGDVHLLIK